MPELKTPYYLVGDEGLVLIIKKLKYFCVLIHSKRCKNYKWKNLSRDKITILLKELSKKFYNENKSDVILVLLLSKNNDEVINY